MSLTDELIADLEELDNEGAESSEDSEDDEGEQQMDFQLQNQEEDEFVEPDFEALQSKDVTKIAKLYNSKSFQDTLKVPILVPFNP